MKYIAICGTVGAGKTTLLQRLTAYFGPRAAFHEERPQDNPYINEYYSDSKRWSFHSQVSFLSLYFDDEKWRPEVGDTEFFFFDRAFLENLVIAKYRLNQQDLTQDEFDILCKLAHGIFYLARTGGAVHAADFPAIAGAGDVFRERWRAGTCAVAATVVGVLCRG